MIQENNAQRHKASDDFHGLGISISQVQSKIDSITHLLSDTMQRLNAISQAQLQHENMIIEFPPGSCELRHDTAGYHEAGRMMPSDICRVCGINLGIQE